MCIRDRAGGLHKVDLFTGLYRLITVEFATTPYDPFFNANAPEDLAEAERITALADQR